MKRPDRFVVVVKCPFCIHGDIPWNQHSTVRKCKNIDCGEAVRLRDVNKQIDEKLRLQSRDGD